MTKDGPAGNVIIVGMVEEWIPHVPGAGNAMKQRNTVKTNARLITRGLEWRDHAVICNQRSTNPDSH
jgi:hypothetical protein